MAEDNDLVDDTSGRRSPKAPGLRSSSLRTESVRKRRAGSKSEDHFYLPEALVAQLKERGLSHEFKRVSYFGKEEDPDYHIGLAENGWEPLSLKSFPDFTKLLPKTWTKDTFEKRGQMLMVRPQELTDEARREDAFMANNQVKGHLASLTNTKDGEAPRDNKGNPLVQFKRTYERGIPVE